MQSSSTRLRVAHIWREAEDITGLDLVAPHGGPLPAFTAGAHVLLGLPGGLIRQYSLCNDPAERHRYRLAVLRARDSRGGSAYVAERLRTGDEIDIQGPRNNFPLSAGRSDTLLIAGGIGITPLLSMMFELARQDRPYHLVYCTRSSAHAAFRQELSAPPFAAHVEFIHDEGDPTRGIDLGRLLGGLAPGTEVYCCGPQGLMSAVRNAGAHLPAGALHFESFSAPGERPSQNDETSSFEIELARSGRVLTVPEGKSILNVLRADGFQADSLCEEGYCGTCVVPLLAGEADHRDTVLSDAERTQNRAIAICCSRARSRRLTLDL